MRVATLDIGSNSLLLLVAEQGPDGSLKALAEHSEITRLGRGVDETGRLDEAALASTLAVAKRYVDIARKLGAGRIAATATSAARDAKNSSQLIQGLGDLGVRLEIISGQREAQLAYRAVAADFAGDEELVVADIGGGSTEIIVGQGPDIRFRRSLNVGAVRLTERCIKNDPPLANELKNLRQNLSAAFANLPSVKSPAQVVCIGGTFTTLAAMLKALPKYDPTLIHQSRITLSELKTLADQLSKSTQEQRLQLPGLAPRRAEVITAGALLAVDLLENLKVSKAFIGDRGVRWGLAWELLGG